MKNMVQKYNTLYKYCVQSRSPVCVHKTSEMYIAIEVINKQRVFRLMKTT